MNTILEYILDELNYDIVCHELIVQCIKSKSPTNGPQLSWKDVLKKLLSDQVEIGEAKLKTPDILEFIAWRGSVSERISRAVECVNKAISSSTVYPYCICLRECVDRYEGEEQQESDQNS